MLEVGTPKSNAPQHSLYEERENLMSSLPTTPEVHSIHSTNSLWQYATEVRKVCGTFEQVTFAYLAWTLCLLLAFHNNIPHAAKYAALQAIIAAAIAQLAWSAARSQNPALQFARHWYPLPLYIFFFEELQALVHAIHRHWFDRWLIQFDYNLAGVHPSVWLARFANPALNETMQFAYMTYFLYLVILPALLYIQKERAAFWTVMVSTAIAHYCVYIIAVLFPIESPHFALASLNPSTLNGGAFTATIELIEHFGRVHGAAFPSAHVAGSMVAILAARRYKPWLFWLCLPFFMTMCIATVYGRYHYVADVLAGLAVGAAGWATGQWLMDRQDALQRWRNTAPERNAGRPAGRQASGRLIDFLGFEDEVENIAVANSKKKP
jgi:membrane-associated phospholipid phosphatase